ncbi:hypothetical protein LINGRAHAP2_LOCUS10736 [Linum grandiflorum]
MGDDLWLLSCPSKEEALRISGLHSSKFEDFIIQSDLWIPEAGCSNVLGKHRLAWIRAFGIPLHLRSCELFQLIEDFCGRFIEVDISNWFADGIRIKIFVEDDIPDEVNVRFQNTIFPIAITIEPSPSASRPIEISTSVVNEVSTTTLNENIDFEVVPRSAEFASPKTVCGLADDSFMMEPLLCPLEHVNQIIEPSSTDPFKDLEELFSSWVGPLHNLNESESEEEVHLPSMNLKSSLAMKPQSVIAQKNQVDNIEDSSLPSAICKNLEVDLSSTPQPNAPSQQLEMEMLEVNSATDEESISEEELD